MTVETFVQSISVEEAGERGAEKTRAEGCSRPTFRVVRRVWETETLFVEPVAPAPKTRVSGSPRMTAAMRKQQQQRALRGGATRRRTT